MKHSPALFLALGALSAAACKSHTHTGPSQDEKVTLTLTRVR